MKRAIYRRFLIMIIIAAAICGVISALFFAAESDRQTRDSLSSMCVAVSRLYEAKAPEESDWEYLREASGIDRVTIIDAGGAVLYDSGAESDSMDNHDNREEFLRANVKTPVTVSRRSDTLGRPFMYAAIKLPDDNVLRLARQYSGIYGSFFAHVPTVAASIIAAFVIAVFVADSFSRRVIRPLEQTADYLAAENYDALRNSAGYYETDRIIKSIGAILEKKRASQLETKAEKEKLEYVMSNMAEGFILVDKKQKIRMISFSAKKIFRCDIDVMGQDISVLIRNAKVAESINSALTDGISSVFDIDFGEAVYSVRVSSLPGKLFQSDGNAATLLIVDVTSDRAAVRLRSEFFANASHELKTPATSILGFAQMLEQGMTDDDKLGETYGRISAEAKRMSDLISDVLTISRLENGTAVLEKERLNVGTVAIEVCDALIPQAEAAGVSMMYTCPHVYITADRRQVYDLINNLADNAITYNQRFGSMSVIVAAAAGGVTIVVKDSGVGIAPEVQSRVFERFYRNKASYSGTEKLPPGTGLGLSIVKHIVSGMNGTLEMKSAVGQGTEITVFLPAG
ncbi:PAS domain-containing sensor histidine kinase [Clostridia bacterium]|nr:PAS domain-containing sensor histidine kinase [Clostridia bacterium]